MQKGTFKKTFKIYFKDSIRRVTFGETIKDLDQMISELNDLYHSEGLYHPELKLQWVDDEGDKVTVSTQLEWTEMLETLKDENPIKLYITEGALQGKYFKDGPPPVVADVYAQDAQGKKSKQDKTVAIQAPAAISSLFPNGKILPYNIPQWLRGAISVKMLGRSDIVDLDIDVKKLVSAVHERGYQLMEEGKNRAAKELFKVIIALLPRHVTALYNLACAESLEGNLDSALNYLERAVACGYANVDHLNRDTDLDNIRTHERYVAIIKQLQPEQEIKQEQPEEEEKDEEVVEEEQKEQVTVEETTEEKTSEESAQEIIENALRKYRYAKKARRLAQLGFDIEVIKVVLDSVRGNFNAALNYLMVMSQSN